MKPQESISIFISSASSDTLKNKENLRRFREFLNTTVQKNLDRPEYKRFFLNTEIVLSFSGPITLEHGPGLVREVIRNQIARTDIFIALVTKDWLASQHCQFEALEFLDMTQNKGTYGCSEIFYLNQSAKESIATIAAGSNSIADYLRSCVHISDIDFRTAGKENGTEANILKAKGKAWDAIADTVTKCIVCIIGIKEGMLPKRASPKYTSESAWDIRHVNPISDAKAFLSATKVDLILDLVDELYLEEKGKTHYFLLHAGMLKVLCRKPDVLGDPVKGIPNVVGTKARLENIEDERWEEGHTYQFRPNTDPDRGKSQKLVGARRFVLNQDPKVPVCIANLKKQVPADDLKVLAYLQLRPQNCVSYDHSGKPLLASVAHNVSELIARALQKSELLRPDQQGQYAEMSIPIEEK
ncbi:MAG: hypothetical protein SF002_07020 [Alphaproteobacteria bacterium]|nr:hypothetical protein [Alphaproteobacteria bacterium]